MEPSQLPPQASSSGTNQAGLSELSSGELKQQALSRIAQILQPVAASTIAAGNASLLSVFKTSAEQTVKIAPPVRIAGKESLLLASLPKDFPLPISADKSVPLQSLIASAPTNANLPVLLKITPENIQTQLTQTQFNTLLNVLSRSLQAPAELPVTIIQQDSRAIRLNIGNPKPVILDLPLPQNNANAKLSAPASEGTQNSNIVSGKAIITVSPKQSQWLVQLSIPESGATVERSATPSLSNEKIANKSVAISLPVSSPTVTKLTQVFANQGVTLEVTPKLSESFQQLLPEKIATKVAALSSSAPVSLNIQGKEVMISGHRTQLLGAAQTPIEGLSQSLPKISGPQAKQLNIQPPTTGTLQKLDLSVLPRNRISQPEPGSTSADSPSQSVRAVIAESVPEGKSAISNEANKIESIAKFKLAQLTPDIKTSLEQFVRSANRLNVVNTEPKLPNVAELSAALQSLTKRDPAFAKPITEIINQLRMSSVPTPIADTSEAITNKQTNPAPESAQTTLKANTETGQLSAAIKQLVTSAAWLQTPLSISSPPSGQSFMSGLIQLLQVSLLGRHYKQQDDIEQILSRQKNTGSTNSPTTSLLGSLTGRQVREFAQLDSQQNILKQLKGLLAGHQSSKLKNMEQALQGQDSFYYALPAIMPEQQATEILIRREKERDAEQNNDTDSAHWQLTMKLDIGELGELLTKAKIVGEQIYLDIYSSNQPLLEKVGVTLPFLLKRFKQLGLTVEEHKLQLGKIPDSLSSRPYSILETQA